MGSPGGIVKIAAPTGAQMFYNALRVGPRVILRSAFELLRANMVTRALSALVLLSIDTISLVKRRISLKQYIVNIGLASMLLVGGTIGWILGGHVIALVLIENAVLGIVAGLIGAGAIGAALASLWERLVSLFYKGDNAEMLERLNAVFAEEAAKARLTEDQIALVKDCIEITHETIRSMFTSADKDSFAREIVCAAIRKTMQN